MSNLNPDQFLHYSNHEFAPGDEVVPPSERGLRSRYGGNPDYRADRVYIAHPDAQYDPGFHHYGVHAYVVEPQGPVERDPEGVSLERMYKEHGYEPDSLDVERAQQQLMAPRARVVRHHSSDDSFGGSGAGI